MRIIKRATLLTLAAALLIAALSGFSKPVNPDIERFFTSFRDIPGVREDEINEIEELQKQNPTLIYGAPFSTELFINSEGETDGYTVLLCDWLTELFGIIIKPVIYDKDELPAMLENGEIQFTGDLTSINELRKTPLMTSDIAERIVKVVKMTGNLSFSDISDKGQPGRFKLALIEGSFAAESVISSFESEYGGFDVIYVEDYAQAYELLKNNQADAFFCTADEEIAFTEYEDISVSDYLPLFFQSVSLSTRRQAYKPIITVTQKALDNGAFDHLSDLYKRGYTNYLKYKLFTTFTEEEIEYIKNTSSVPIIAENWFYPLNYYNKYEKQWEGIGFDVLEAVTSLTGLNFVVANGPDTPWADMYEMMQNGEALISLDMIYTQERADRFLWSKYPYLSEKYAILSKRDYPIVDIIDIQHEKIGLIKSTGYAQMFEIWFPDARNAVTYGSQDEAFSALDNGEVDLIMAGTNALSSIANYYELSNYKANLIMDKLIDYMLVYNKESPVLYSIVEKAIASINLINISERWASKPFDYQFRLLAAQRPWLIGVTALFAVLFILLFIIFQKKRVEGRTLELLVESRTADLSSMNEDLEIALQDAEAANRAKSVFLANMSHEIRTPMNAIIGITDIQLQNDSLESNLKDSFHKIYNSGLLLLGIINDILDLSKIESGNMELSPAKYDLASLINDVATLNMTRIGDKDIVFDLNVDKNVPSILIGDELRIKQILNNLLSNAFKYTQKGKVTLTVSFENFDDAEAKGIDADVTLIVKVQDTGQGMTERQLSKLFDKYTRFNNELNRKVEGTGLGMSITKSLIVMMQGTIDAESEQNKGSLFTVRLPQESVGSEVIGKEVAESLKRFRLGGTKTIKRERVVFEPLSGGSLLAVDDMEINLEIVRGLLAPYKLHIDDSPSGRDAIEKIKQGKEYDIIFMDHMMPEMDGVEATKQIRALGYTKPIIALTANAVVGQAEIFISSGFDDFISKPIDMRQMDALLKKYLKNKK